MAKSNIVISGFMASGKTTIGLEISEAVGKPVVDTDTLIEEEAGRSVKDIFTNEGEEAFREIERRVVARESSREGIVLAVGGGALLDRRNVAELKKLGVIYLLDVTPQEVVRRVGPDESRPLLPAEISDVERLMQEREASYSHAVDVVVRTTGRDPKEIAADIASDFESRCRLSWGA